MKVPCPTCGSMGELPRITPELLFFRSSNEGADLPAKAVTMEGGTLAVPFAGVIYQMRPDEWAHLQTLRQNWHELPLDQAAA